MRLVVGRLIVGMCVMAVGAVATWQSTAIQAQASRAPAPSPPQRINLADRLTTGALSVGNRAVSLVKDRPDAIYVTEGNELSVIWLDGTDFAEGTIEVDVRGRDVLQKSFLGVAFHRRDDKTFDSVYLRPFNFRAADPARHQHAVQYMAVPDHDWARLRKEFPEEFESPVDSSVSPTDWVPLRIDVTGRTIQIFVGAVQTPTLEVRKLGLHDRGMVGLWTGAGSDGSFANVRVTSRR
jgi:hypothetical protein